MFIVVESPRAGDTIYRERDTDKLMACVRSNGTIMVPAFHRGTQNLLKWTTPMFPPTMTQFEEIATQNDWIVELVTSATEAQFRANGE